MHIYDMYLYIGFYGPFTQLLNKPYIENCEFEIVQSNFLMTIDQRFMEIQYKTTHEGMEYLIHLKGLKFIDKEQGIVRETIFTIRNSNEQIVELDYCHASRLQENYTLSQKNNFIRRYSIAKEINAEKKLKKYNDIFEKQKANLNFASSTALSPLQEIEKHTYILMSDLIIYDACTMPHVACTPNSLARITSKIVKIDNWWNSEFEFQLFATSLEETLQKTYDFIHPSLKAIRQYTDFGFLYSEKKSNYQGLGLVCKQMAKLFPYQTNLVNTKQDSHLLNLPSDILRSIVARVLNVYPETLYAHKHYVAQHNDHARG